MDALPYGGFLIAPKQRGQRDSAPSVRLFVKHSQAPTMLRFLDYSKKH
jgi:hypothetical protein